VTRTNGIAAQGTLIMNTPRVVVIRNGMAGIRTTEEAPAVSRCSLFCCSDHQLAHRAANEG
jgi:hypothetical protein